MTQFVHCHCHSRRSFKDGLNTVGELVDRAIELEQPGIAITEHGHMHSAAQLALATKDKPIKPIFGMEAYEAVPHTWDLERDADILKRPWDSGQPRYHHLTIWVMNATGWRNLCALHSKSYTLEYKPKNQPLIDRANLEKHADGLMIGLGCLASKTSMALSRADADAAYAEAKWYVEVFGQDRVFMEVMANLQDQIRIIRGQREVAKHLGIPTLATNDVHYRDREDGAEGAAHHILVQARRFKKANTEESKDRSDDGFGAWYGSDEFFLKSGAEMLATGGLEPAEIERSLEVLDKVTFDFHDDLPDPKPPLAPIPEPGENEYFDTWLESTQT